LKIPAQPDREPRSVAGVVEVREQVAAAYVTPATVK
jgi:hypothetical protein